MNYKVYLKTKYWLETRDKVYKRDEYRCRICNSEDSICVHHRTYENLGNENLEDLITLCKSCHQTYHKINDKLIKKHNKQIEYQKHQEMLEKERIKYYNFIDKNKDKFTMMIDKINGDNFIKCSEFRDTCYKICKRNFNDKNRFYTYCVEYFSLVFVYQYKQTMKDNYKFPKKTTKLLVTKEFYSKYYKDCIKENITIY